MATVPIAMTAIQKLGVFTMVCLHFNEHGFFDKIWLKTELKPPVSLAPVNAHQRYENEQQIVTKCLTCGQRHRPL